MQHATGAALGLFGQGAPSWFFPFSMGLVVLILYVMVLRPQARRQKQREAMLKQVHKGDRILTTSGIFGTVVSTKGDDVLVVKIADNVRVEMARPAVASVLASESEGSSG